LEEEEEGEGEKREGLSKVELRRGRGDELRPLRENFIMVLLASYEKRGIKAPVFFTERGGKKSTSTVDT